MRANVSAGPDTSVNGVHARLAAATSARFAGSSRSFPRIVQDRVPEMRRDSRNHPCLFLFWCVWVCASPTVDQSQHHSASFSLPRADAAEGYRGIGPL